ncbi:MAG: secondary thiamine-phosphate synthase enzyme YjbQ [Alphaproteobacteria bacterium]
MQQKSGELEIATERQGLLDITGRVLHWAGEQGLRDGLLTVFCRHTSASLLIQENAAPEARVDLEAYFRRLAPENPGAYLHDDEGPDDMPAYLRAALTQVHLSIPVVAGRLTLGTWQGIYLFEHRVGAHRRSLVLQFLGLCG